MKKTIRCLLAVLLGLASGVAVAATTPATLYPMPHCSCCGKYAQYLDQHGFHVTMANVASTAQLEKVAKQDDVPLTYRQEKSGMNSGICHITTVGGYVVVGTCRPR